MTNNTIRSFAFSVTPRPKPPEYVFTPTERLTFEGLVQKVDDAVADMIRRAESGEFDGHTPIKGTDYFTASEIQQIQNEVSSGAIGEFKTVVDTETETFNNNAETKLNAYNQNDSQKTTAYNTNATEKLNAYNTNANNRVAEFDSHTEQIQTDISELKSDLDNKLPKSPADWEQWTAEDQAMARARMDVDGVYRHIAYVEITEEGIINIGFDVDINGNPFSLSDIKIYGFIKKMASNFSVAVALNNKFTTINGGHNIIKFPANGVSSEIHINKAKYWRASAFTSQSSDGTLGGITGYAIVSHRGASIVRNNEWKKASSLSICTSNEEGFAVGTIFDIWGR